MSEHPENDEIKEGKDYTWVWLPLSLMLLLGACISYPFILRSLIHWLNPGELDKYGQVGDMFGALNAFISGCAFIGVIVSLYLQRQDLKLQRKDLALQLNEMRNAHMEAEKQTKHFEEQVQLGKDAQFADDFYRRMSLLKAMEQDITYCKSKGAHATVRLASHINKLITLILDNKLDEATVFYTDNNHDILLAIDKFKVWGNSFLSLVKDIHEQRKLHAFHGIKQIEEKENGTLVLKLVNRSSRHYRSILIESTIWGEQFLLILIYNTIFKAKRSAISNLMEDKSFGRGSTIKRAKDVQYQNIFFRLYRIDREDEIASQISKIYKDLVICNICNASSGNTIKTEAPTSTE